MSGPFFPQVNDINVLEVGVPYKDFHTLDENSALDLVRKDPIFQEKFSQLNILQISLKITDDHAALLSLTLPEFSFGIHGSMSEMKKQKKKMSKQKKRLHVMES